jgi:transglutaminase-like putative cysteine protease
MTDYDPRLAPQIQWTWIPGGVWGTTITLETMANLARTGSKSDGIRSIADSLPDVGFVDSVLRPIYRYRDEFDEIVRSPEFMLQDLSEMGYIEGDCDDAATLSASITCAMGISTRLTAIAVHGPDEYDHVFSEAKVNGEWLPIDITVPLGTQYVCYRLMSETVC